MAADLSEIQQQAADAAAAAERSEHQLAAATASYESAPSDDAWRDVDAARSARDRARVDTRAAEKRRDDAQHAADAELAGQLRAQYEEALDRGGADAARRAMAPIVERLVEASRAIDRALDDAYYALEPVNAAALECDRFAEQLYKVAVRAGLDEHVKRVSSYNDENAPVAHRHYSVYPPDARLSDAQAMIGAALYSARQAEGRMLGYNEIAMARRAIAFMMIDEWPTFRDWSNGKWERDGLHQGLKLNGS